MLNLISITFRTAIPYQNHNSGMSKWDFLNNIIAACSLSYNKNLNQEEGEKDSVFCRPENCYTFIHTNKLFNSIFTNRFKKRASLIVSFMKRKHVMLFLL